MQQVHHRIAPRGIAVVAGGQVDRDPAVCGVADAVALQRLQMQRFHHDAALRGEGRCALGQEAKQQGEETGHRGVRCIWVIAQRKCSLTPFWLTTQSHAPTS